MRIAPDGEILMRGPWIMRGYHGLPEPTAEALDADGWLHTGDVGTVDADGFLTITDRKKDLIKTSGGKYVAPTELESKLKALSPWIVAGARARRPAQLRDRARHPRSRGDREVGGARTGSPAKPVAELAARPDGAGAPAARLRPRSTRRCRASRP